MGWCLHHPPWVGPPKPPGMGLRMPTPFPGRNMHLGPLIPILPVWHPYWLRCVTLLLPPKNVRSESGFSDAAVAFKGPSSLLGKIVSLLHTIFLLWSDDRWQQWILLSPSNYRDLPRHLVFLSSSPMVDGDLRILGNSQERKGQDLICGNPVWPVAFLCLKLFILSKHCL